MEVVLFRSQTFGVLKSRLMLRRLPAEPRSSPLRRELRLPQVIGLGVATIVGSGIFVVLGPLYKEYAGSMSFLCFPLAAIPALLSALCYGEFASKFSCAGQAYTYLYMSLGEIYGYMAGTLTVFSYLVATSAVAKGFQLYIGGLWYISPILLIICTGLSLQGIKESASIAAYLAAANCAFMLGIMIYGGYNYGSITTIIDGFEYPSITGLFKGAGLAYFTTLGWDLICVISSETVNPDKDVVLGLLGSLAIVTLLYSSLAIVLLSMVKPSDFHLSTPLLEAFRLHGDENGAIVALVMAGFLCTSSVLTGILAPPRILARMANDGLVFRVLANCNEVGVPYYGTLVTGIIGVVFVLTLNFENLAKLTSAASLCIFTLVAIGLMKNRRNGFRILPVLLLSVAGTLQALEYLSVFGVGVLVLWTMWEWRQARPIKELHQSLLDLDQESNYKCPGMPVVPVISVVLNSYTLGSLGETVIFGTLLLFGASLILYFVYGLRHSTLGRVTE